MNLPTLINKLYNQITFTGLYSFEFVDKNKNTITEVFLLTPPKNKNVSESTRSTTVPTLGGNYIIDGGNATKTVTLSGMLYFEYIGSPDNPVARENTGLENTLSGIEEFLKLRFLLIRYRDYTLTSNAKMTVPTEVMAVSEEILTLYKKIAKKVKDKTGGLYDEIKVIFHDYDMDDHYYCRIDNFTSNQSDSKYNAIEYSITIECHEPDNRQNYQSLITQVKESTNTSINSINNEINKIDFESAYDSIQAEVGYNTSFLTNLQTIISTLEDIDTENENIQAGKSTASTLLPIYVSTISSNVNESLEDFITTFLSTSQQTLYNTGTVTIDDIVSRDLLNFYNSLQRIKIQMNSLQGILNSIVKIDEIRYYADADDYTLTEEQFDDDDSNKIENITNFFYYTVMAGDTARIIAQRELKNQELFIQILKLNNISENDFIDGNLIGEKIKIPFQLNTTARGDDNLIFESDYTDNEKFLFGADLAVNVNNELQISESGDLKTIIGIENVYINIENRILNLKGSLNIFNPNWGSIAVDDGNAPFLVKIDRYLTDVLFQIQSDPRVESAKMDLDNLKFIGETITVPVKIFFIGTEETREVVVNG